MSISILDILCLVIIAVCILIATIKGFVKCFLSKAAIIVSILLAVSFTPNAAEIIKKWVDIKYVTTILAFIAVFVIAFLVLKLFQLLIEKIFSGRILKTLDRIFGAVWGVLIGLLFVIAILLILKIQPFANTQSLLETSWFAKMLLPFFSDYEIVKNGINLTMGNISSRG